MPGEAEDMGDLDQPATKRDLLALETRLEVRFEVRFDELRRHVDVVVESFKTEFGNLYDWTPATTSSLALRIDRLETNHGSRLLTLETRVARLEKRRK